MKKALLFLVLFGAGLALLLWLRPQRAEKPRPPADTKTRSEAPDDFTKIPALADAKTGERQTIGVVLSGKLELTQFAGEGTERPRKVELTSTDVQAVGGEAYDMRGLEVRVYDSRTAELRAKLTSPLSRVDISTEKDRPSITRDDRARLTNADVRLERGVPIAPLDLHFPKLTWEIMDERLLSDEHVTAKGRGFDAEGDGIVADNKVGSLDLLKHGVVSLTLPDGRKAILRATGNGSIVVNQIEKDGAPHIDLLCVEGSHFEVEGSEPIAIDAEHLHMIGRIPGGTEKDFAIVTADAHGKVIVTSGGDTFRSERAGFTFGANNRLQTVVLDDDVVLARGTEESFRGRHADFEFDALGELRKATLAGAPSGTVAAGRWLARDRPELQHADAEISGAGPLVLTREREASSAGGTTRKWATRLDLAGPGKMELKAAGLLIEASTHLAATVAADERSGTMTASGSVRAHHTGDLLETDTLEIDYTLDEQGESIVRGASRGITRLTTERAEAKGVELTALDGLSMRIEGKKLFVPSARDVHIVVPGPNGLDARAKLVTKLDWEARTFEADGDVRHTTAQGTGTADHAESRGPDDFLLRGRAGEPAHYELRKAGLDPKLAVGAEVFAEAFGQEIHALKDRLLARGEVRTRVVGADHYLDARSEEMDVELGPEGLPGTLDPREFHLKARREVHAHVVRAGEVSDIVGDALYIDGRMSPRPSNPSSMDIALSSVRAEGAVDVSYAGAGNVDAHGDLFTIDENGKGRLSAGVGRRVQATGRFPGTTLPYSMGADWIDFDKENLEASQVIVKMRNKPDLSTVIDLVSGRRSFVLTELRAQNIRATPSDIVLRGQAHVDGVTSQGEEWFVDAGTIELKGDFAKAESVKLQKLQSMRAEGEFHAHMGERLDARGDRLEGTPGHMRIEGKPAHLELLEAEWESTRIEFDTENMLLATDEGLIHSSLTSDTESWSIAYTSMEPFDQGDTTILVLKNPRFRFGAKQMFADWTLFWVDRDRWQRSGQRVMHKSMRGEELRVTHLEDTQLSRTEQEKGEKDDLLAKFKKNTIFKVLSEAYFEGNLEFYDAGERVGRAGGLYIDLVEEHGWMQDADMYIPVDLRELPQRVRAKAEWMRVSAGPSFRADHAVLTTCDYDDPHYVIETGDLRIERHPDDADDRVEYSVSAEKNALRIEGGLTIPLPAIVFETNKQGRPLIDRFVLGNSAKFGTQIRASINAELGSFGLGLGNVLGKVLQIEAPEFTGGTRYDVGFLGSRGFLFGAGLDLHVKDKFDLDIDYSIIPDNGTDRGLVRVDRDDRSLLRDWLRMRGRYTVDNGEWIDVVLSKQSDAGVQSEFFEREYLAYERKDTYLHWRKATEQYFFDSSVKVRIEDRTDIDELPSAGAFRGRTPITHLGELPLYYTARADAAYLQRREGDPRYYAAYPDGLGDREVSRFDTEHRLELPVSVGAAALRATPWVSGRVTAWSEGVDPEDQPARAWLLAGFDVSTTLWKRSRRGSVNTITPFVGVHGDLVTEESGGTPVRFDSTEDPIEGRFVDVGVRTRWWKVEERDRLDLEVRESIGDGLPSSAREGLQPLAVLGEYLTFLGEVPLGLTHDARYDLRDAQTVYSRSYLGFEPRNDLGFEFGYNSGLSFDDERLYEAVSGAVRWRWTTKWELELLQSYSFLDSESLNNGLALRRMGHDFIVELEFGYRAGEGSSFGLSFQPRLSWKRSNLGLIDRWLGMYH